MNIKKCLCLFSILMVSYAQMSKADTACPSDIIKSFAGKFQGQAVLVHANGVQEQSVTQAEYMQVDCQSFGATFNYLDSSGNIVRTINFTASPDSENAGLFAIHNGTTADGKSAPTEIKGSFRQIQNGTLLGTFVGSLGGKAVYMTELMNVTNPQNGVKQLVRTVQMFAGDRGGPYLASRVDSEQSK